MRVGDIMSQEVISVKSNTTVKDAAQIMLNLQISGLPVLDDKGALIGIVTEGDLLRRVEAGTERRRSHWLECLVTPGTLAREYVQAHGRKLCEVMTKDVVTVTEDHELSEAVDLMEQRHVKRLPVVRDGKVVGMLSRANLLHALVATHQTNEMKAEDKAIRDQIWVELNRHRWNARGGNIIVKDGVVDLWGSIADDSHRDAIIVAAENVPGVKEVRDHLLLVPPYGAPMYQAGSAQSPAMVG
jgi:CBS-domain-containing membrane protein